ncbi:MAG: OmpA family protein [Terricaulis sp.]
MRKLLSTLAAAALLAGIGGGAQAKEGWYGRADVGYSVDGQVDGTFFDGEQTFRQSADLDDGWLADVGIGHAYGNGVRAELELARRNNDINQTNEEADATSLMLNGFYDFNRDGRFQPYIGLGIGYANVEIANFDDSDFAWQALAGVGVKLSERTMFDIGYRLFNVDGLDLGGVETDYEHQAVTLGLRHQFGAAPAPVPVAQPAPAPAPAPVPPPVACPTSEFVVYFEWDRSNLNQEANAVIDQAVARARACNVNSVAIVGHTDTSGSNAYNMGLSERRASIVREALVSRGLSASSMTTQARGESEMARATRDGVREPLNRRAAVTISFR